MSGWAFPVVWVVLALLVSGAAVLRSTWAGGLEPVEMCAITPRAPDGAVSYRAELSPLATRDALRLSGWGHPYCANGRSDRPGHHLGLGRSSRRISCGSSSAVEHLRGREIMRTYCLAQKQPVREVIALDSRVGSPRFVMSDAE